MAKHSRCRLRCPPLGRDCVQSYAGELAITTCLSQKDHCGRPLSVALSRVCACGAIAHIRGVCSSALFTSINRSKLKDATLHTQKTAQEMLKYTGRVLDSHFSQKMSVSRNFHQPRGGNRRRCLIVVAGERDHFVPFLVTMI